MQVASGLSTLPLKSGQAENHPEQALRETSPIGRSLPKSGPSDVRAENACSKAGIGPAIRRRRNQPRPLARLDRRRATSLGPISR